MLLQAFRHHSTQYSSFLLICNIWGMFYTELFIFIWSFCMWKFICCAPIVCQLQLSKWKPTVDFMWLWCHLTFSKTNYLNLLCKILVHKNMPFYIFVWSRSCRFWSHRRYSLLSLCQDVGKCGLSFHIITKLRTDLTWICKLWCDLCSEVLIEWKIIVG